jgi:hAT family C-terminal dimerisation region
MGSSPTSPAWQGEIMAFAATSAALESCFSDAGNVITDQRTLLDTEQAQELIFCRDNSFAYHL